MYNAKSLKAEEFISDEEIKETLAYADANKDNVALIDEIIEKAKLRKGLNHREASVLLACEIPEKIQEVYELAEQIKRLLRKPYRIICTALPVKLLCKRLCILSVSSEKQTHCKKETDTGRYRKRSYCTAGYGT